MAMTDIPVYAVLTNPEEKASDTKDDAEVIDEVEWLSLDEVGERVLKGNIRWALTLSAISYAFAARGKIADFIRKA